MKIVVLIPYDEYRRSAGARIRYGRLASALKSCGFELRLQTVGSFLPDRVDCDVLLISKCHDARSVIAAAVASRRGILVGVDLFDDYFSQVGDVRLAQYRWWLSELLQSSSFALSSTPKLERVVGEYSSNLPTHVLNDPAPEFSPAHLSEVLLSKLQKVRQTKRMGLAWYGMGDNLHFSVGLSDVAAFGPSLASLARDGLDVQLTILTNARALDADGLSRLRSLPVPVCVKEWSEAAEQEVLAESFATFIPVSVQAFSAAKSLNRAISALTAGCQVFSPGYPLYRRLQSFIYEAPELLLADVASESMKLRPETLPSLEQHIHEHASSETEAARLTRFLRSLPTRPVDGRPTVAVIHGRETTAEAHAFVRSAGGLSVASPFCDANLDFDVVFRSKRDGFSALLSKRARACLRNTAQWQRRRRLKGRSYYEVPVSPALPSGTIKPEMPLPMHVATYRRVIEAMQASMEELFGPCQVTVSEHSPFLSPLLP